MSDNFCAICITVCCDVLAGACLDFLSIRHGCIAEACTCTRCSKLNEELDGEREPLIAEVREEPVPHPPMQAEGDTDTGLQ